MQWVACQDRTSNGFSRQLVLQVCVSLIAQHQPSQQYSMTFSSVTLSVDVSTTVCIRHCKPIIDQSRFTVFGFSCVFPPEHEIFLPQKTTCPILSTHSTVTFCKVLYWVHFCLSQCGVGQLTPPCTGACRLGVGHNVGQSITIRIAAVTILMLCVQHSKQHHTRAICTTE